MRSSWLLCLALAGALFADGPGRITSAYSKSDFPLTADPQSKQWRGVKGVFAENGPTGIPSAGHRTEIRSRWTRDNLYILFVCPYQQLYLLPSPSTATETNKLWDHDVAEVFIGSDFDHIRQYKELQVSPQGEWVDLDINRDNPKPEGGWLWNSGYKVKARVDEANHVWYGEMQIPLKALTEKPVKANDELRINFYRLQGPPPNRVYVAWQPTGKMNYHVPEAFGRLIFGK